jgi:hypothetical protein
MATQHLENRSIALQLEEMMVDIVVLKGIRWKGDDIINKKDFSILL